MASMFKDIVHLVARRDEKARAALRHYGNLRKMVRRARKIAREIEKLGGK